MQTLASMPPALSLAMVTKEDAFDTVRRRHSRFERDRTSYFHLRTAGETEPCGTIDIVRALVAAIAEHGTLTGEKVDAAIAAGVTERSIKLERQRREDWRQHERSAHTVLTDGFRPGNLIVSKNR